MCRSNEGEPYAERPIMSRAISELAHWRSAFYPDALIARSVRAHAEVPLPMLAGWDDDGHPTVETVAPARKLQRADAHWPVA